MRRLPPEVAVRSFAEVVLGYSKDEAVAEAERALTFDLAAASEACPFHVDIPSFVRAIAEGAFTRALEQILRAHPWPGILGRHCTRPCEGHLAVDASREHPFLSGLERAAGDYGDWSQLSFTPGTPSGFRVAVVGAGSTGGAAAYGLRSLGHAVAVFDQMPFGGGMMSVGYPEFRLPPEVLRREWAFERWGVDSHYGRTIDSALLAGLREDYDAVLITTGKFKAMTLGCPGDELRGVWSALDFLIQFRTGQKPTVGRNALVLGGGYTARDVSRTCRRLGANVQVLYRGTESQMPVAPMLRERFVAEQKAEGAPYVFSTVVTEILGDENGHVRAVRVAEVSPDPLNRVVIPGTEMELPTDMVLAAIGEETDLSFLPPSVERDREGHIATDSNGQTSLPYLFAAGEVAGVSKTSNAMTSGVEVAGAIHRALGRRRVSEGAYEHPGRQHT